jgi:hypothetical protein
VSLLRIQSCQSQAIVIGVRAPTPANPNYTQKISPAASPLLWVPCIGSAPDQLLSPKTNCPLGRVVRHRRPFTDEWLTGSTPPSCPALALPRRLGLSTTQLTKTSSLNLRRAPSPKHSNPPTSFLSPDVDEVNLFKAHKVSTRNPITLLHLVSFAFLAVVLVSVHDPAGTLIIMHKADNEFLDCSILLYR